MRRSVLLGVALCAVALLAIGANRPNQSTPSRRIPGGIVMHAAGPAQIKPFVRGYLAVRAPLGMAGSQLTAAGIPRRFRDVFLPRVEVSLLNLANNSRSKPVTTDLSGRFTLPAAAGRYRVCWEAKGMPSGCIDNVFSVANAPVHLGTVRTGFKAERGLAAVFGNVQLADGSSLRLLEPLADLNAFGRVVLLNEDKKELYEALVNNFGDYFIPGVPVKAHVFLAVRAEGGETLQEILPGEPGGRRLPPDRPRPAERRAARRAADTPARLRRPRAGREPRRAAEARGGGRGSGRRPGRARWLANTGTGSLVPTGDTTADWKLPAAEGLYSLAVIASDGKGGHTRRTLSVRASTQGVVFSGRVVRTEGTPIARARVSVNGRPATTDAVGFFRLHVPAEQRYVVNVRATGFAFLSLIYDRGVTGAVYRLRRATVQTADPTQDIDLQDKRTQRDCPGPASLRFDAKLFPGGVRPGVAGRQGQRHRGGQGAAAVARPLRPPG